MIGLLIRLYVTPAVASGLAIADPLIYNEFTSIRRRT
jgi:hypothetical protein